MKTEAKRLNAVIRDIRLCFNILYDRANDLHKDLQINASMRAVMESLSHGEEKTVPTIAKEKNVSRQHIQIIVNVLLEDNLVRSAVNPDDRRTYLISMTELGREKYSEVQSREFTELQKLCDLFTTEELRVTSKTLQKLSKTLKGKTND
jgi:DNA-binding MarR family transcriptional regulator|tara:strand:+ start:101077 stop:101523 length:447 start_codon:yes stop_codon:yes gene_type:complete